MAPLKLYMAICKRRPGGGARHWILILAEDGVTNSTWYHSTGGPTQGKPYKVEIQVKRFDSHGIDSHHLIGEISDKDKKKVKASAQKVTGKFCQRWAVDVLGNLEKKGLVPGGTSNRWSQSMEADPYSSDGAQSGQAEAGPSSSSAGGQSQASTAPYAQTKWVWDEAEQRYRYFDTDTQEWVWQQ